ncbi:alpha/beta-hydrolase [Collybia nuda]|uniref:Alpha/beta-hydrolase n=1 Tax=Collybia nuda TaxID=64659 RepID=A0A9P6CPD7_9AGAR|nr:alpha/beta-hydrolase [Collybia nuda]
MPHIAITSTSGPASIHYTISTPSNASANKIDENLPTLIFIHPVYIAQTIFHPQFADHHLRRFNLVAIDARCHGETTGPVASTWRRADAAEDVFNFMEALGLPPCHLLGVSMGACTALQLAIAYPTRVLSLTLISPLPLQEPREVEEGRQEIYDCWVEGFRDPAEIDELALLDAVHGALQLGFSGEESSLINALKALSFPQAMVNFGPGRFEEFHTASVKFFTDRKPHSTATLSNITCPIQLLHCTGDIAYPLEYAEELEQLIRSAAVPVRLIKIENAPHFGNVTHPKEYVFCLP